MRHYLPFAVAVLVVGCTDRTPTGAGPDFGVSYPEVGTRGITVMTRNVYLGADVDRIVAATDPNEVPPLVTQAFQTLQATNFPERAGALADEIAATRPHLVGLQEVTLYRLQIPGDAAFGGTTPATEVAFDFLAILLDSLAARGLTYVVAVSQQGTDAELPGILSLEPLAFFDVRFTDHDVILARGDVEVENPRSGIYQAAVPVFGGSLFIVRGWTAVDATIAGTRVRFFNTHLETPPPADGAVQVAQASELIELIGGSDRPTFLVGDVNSRADGQGTASYGMILDAGFVDAWSQARPREAGFSCCHDEDLRNAEPALDERIDIIFYRDALTTATGRIAGGVHVDEVGEEPGDRTPSGLWPSDHAGVVATLTLPPAVARLGRR